MNNQTPESLYQTCPHCGASLNPIAASMHHCLPRSEEEAVERYAEEHAGEWEPNAPPQPTTDLGRELFDLATNLNRFYALSLGVRLTGGEEGRLDKPSGNLS